MGIKCPHCEHIDMCAGPNFTPAGLLKAAQIHYTAKYSTSFTGVLINQSTLAAGQAEVG